MQNSFETVEEARRQEQNSNIFLLNISSLSHNLQDFSNVKISKTIFDEWQNRKLSSVQIPNNNVQKILDNKLFQNSDIEINKQFFLNSNQKNAKKQVNKIYNKKVEKKIEYEVKKENKRKMIQNKKQSIYSINTKATHGLFDLNDENQKIIDEKISRGFHVKIQDKQDHKNYRYSQRTRYQRLLEDQGELCLKDKDNYILLLRNHNHNGKIKYKQSKNIQV